MSAIENAIQEINTYIVQNGNEEITADVLRPILVGLADAVKSDIGEVGNLNTTATDLVDAINEVLLVVNNVDVRKTFTGVDDPNVTPPIGFEIGDYYERYLSGTLLNYYQFNGYNWIEII